VTALAALAVLLPAVALVLALLRAGRLEERHALAWLAAATAVCAAVAATPLREHLAGLLAGDAVTAVLAVAVGALAALTLTAFAALTRVTRQARTLAQRLALLEERVAASRAADGDAGAVAGGARWDAEDLSPR